MLALALLATDLLHFDVSTVAWTPAGGGVLRSSARAIALLLTFQKCSLWRAYVSVQLGLRLPSSDLSVSLQGRNFFDVTVQYQEGTVG